MNFNQGANEITIKDIEDIINGDWAATPAANIDDKGPSDVTPDDGNATVDTTTVVNDVKNELPPVTETQAFARRLKEETTKVRNEERESIAKSLGYESFADMQQKREAEMLRDKGLNPEEISPIVEQIVQQRIAEDPRVQEFDKYRQERVNAWAQKELTELNELTDGRIAKLADVPADVLELWKTKGSLKKAYIELYGEALIKETRTSVASGQSRGSTSHMRSPQGTSTPAGDTNKRPYTQQEKDVYRMFNPDVTDDELNKMYKTK